MDTPYKKLFLSIAVSLATFTLAAQIEVSKKISETFTMTNAGELHIDNKYGDIVINGWDEDTISIDVEIMVTHKKRDNAESLLERINPNIRAVNGFVSVTSEISDKNDGFFAKYFNKANPFDYDKSNIQINYTIYMPSKAELEITNKFGDVIIGDWTGKLKGDLQHSDMWINNDLNNADLNLKYGKLRARSINYGSIHINNGAMDIEESKDLRLNSNGTEITIDKISSLEIYSSKDDIVIEEAGTVHGDIKFTNLQLNNIYNEVNLTMKIADFKVLNINNDDVVLTLRQESSKVSLDVKGFAFEFEATLEQGLLRLPKSFKNVDTKMLDKGKRIRKISAHYGNAASGNISITGEKGAIILKDQ